MNGLDGWSYAAVFAGSAVLALVLTPLALRLAVRTDVLDRPGGHKRHDSPVPYLGGLAIVVSFAAALLVAALVRTPVGGTGELGAILGLGVALSAVGLVDDLRGLGAVARLGAQVAAGVALWLVDVRVEIFGPDVLDALVTVVWVVGIANAFNLLDNMDGLSAGVAAIAAGSFFVVAALNGQFLVAALAAGVAGCALGFLRHNIHPASIYMGDAGALFLGFLLAVIGIKLRFDAPTRITFFVPVLVLGVAIFDTTLVTVTRLAHRRNPLSGARDHVSHRLVMVGIPVHAAVGLIYAGAIALGWLAVVMSRVDVATGFILMGLVLSVAAFLGGLLGNVPVYETSTQRHLMIGEARRHEPAPDANIPARVAVPLTGERAAGRDSGRSAAAVGDEPLDAPAGGQAGGQTEPAG